MLYLRRFLSFIASRLFIILVVLSILIVTFYYAMNSVNIYIILKDGMARRAQVILMDEGKNELKSYFSAAELARDPELLQALSGESPYSSMRIIGIDHRVQLQSVWCWPWDNTAKASFTERIPSIDCRTTTSDGAIPQWPERSYQAILSREDDHWLIENLIQVNIR